ncbi:hypothetical protein [Streptomyces lonarensis]|uniref:hypothetical protein n=1 Tax=Streptomyces lonarensis TaxID=700599 RepID=UPI001FD75BA9|nr:hypothetical protein [Streptomyces lonarensis]
MSVTRVLLVEELPRGVRYWHDLDEGVVRVSAQCISPGQRDIIEAALRAPGADLASALDQLLA